MSELSLRLRNYYGTLQGECGREHMTSDEAICHDAADEIERLEAALAAEVTLRSSIQEQAKEDERCWHEVMIDVQQAIGPEHLSPENKRTPLPGTSVPPMNFATAIRNIHLRAESSERRVAELEAWLADLDEVVAWDAGVAVVYPISVEDAHAWKHTIDRRKHDACTRHRARKAKAQEGEGK